ncbi:hypothetical protein [Tardibacter chloracetimidivorans]|uniref:hypothetical protein n=1 Tax=Tardibacter chloracetimidivorans TaxID=1921510 RepID=UPI0013013BBC|nr:hypothetical protein [Tardibacter chloracetimidivorans]
MKHIVESSDGNGITDLARGFIRGVWRLAPYFVGFHGLINRDAMQVAIAAMWLGIRANGDQHE